MLFVASAFGADQPPAQPSAAAANPGAPQSSQRLHEEKIVHRDLAARSSVPTVAPAANPQPGVAPLSVGKSAGCKKGTAPVKGHVDQDCDSDKDRVAGEGGERR